MWAKGAIRGVSTHFLVLIVLKAGVFYFFFFKPLVESSLLLAAVSYSIFNSKSTDLTLFHAFGRIFFLLAAFSLYTFNQESIDLNFFQVFQFFLWATLTLS